MCYDGPTLVGHLDNAAADGVEAGGRVVLGLDLEHDVVVGHVRVSRAQGEQVGVLGSTGPWPLGRRRLRWRPHQCLPGH